MSFDSSAVLAYGYNLGDRFHLDDEDSPRPAWATSDGDVIDDARRALLRAAGANVSHDDYPDDEQLLPRCGIAFAFYGSSTDRSTPLHILAAATFEATMDGPEPVDLALPADADRQLAWALDVLGIEPPADGPRWLLAAAFG